jgi:hypothetical protein
MGKADSSDTGIQNLLDLHRETYALDKGYWATFRAWRVPPSAERPHGLEYALSLHNEQGERIVGYDNAHTITTASGPARKSSRTLTSDHRHFRGKTTHYRFSTAEQLMIDFWADVEKVIEEDQS